MSNVIEFPPVSRRSCQDVPRAGSADHVEAGDVDRQLLDRVVELQKMAKGELRRVILLLDLAVWHGREILARTADPNSRRTIEGQLVVIEQALQVVREKVINL